LPKFAVRWESGFCVVTNLGMQAGGAAKISGVYDDMVE